MDAINKRIEMLQSQIEDLYDHNNECCQQLRWAAELSTLVFSLKTKEIEDEFGVKTNALEETIQMKLDQVHQLSSNLSEVKKNHEENEELLEYIFEQFWAKEYEARVL